MVSCILRHIALIVLSSLRAASALVVTSPPASAATAGPSRRPTARRAQDLLPVPETLRLHTCVPNEPSGLTSGRGSAPQHNALTSRARSSLSECRVRSVASRQARLQRAPSARRPPPHQTSVAERRLPLDTTPSTSGGGRRAGVGAAHQAHWCRNHEVPPLPTVPGWRRPLPPHRNAHWLQRPLLLVGRSSLRRMRKRTVSGRLSLAAAR